jgi:hypothetical protein
VRDLLATGATRASALIWLVDRECEPADTLVDPDPTVFVEVLGITLAQRGPASMVEVFSHYGNTESQLMLLSQLWRQTIPTVGSVLANLGRHHPVAPVAKAARKAAMQHATHQANRASSGE